MMIHPRRISFRPFPSCSGQKRLALILVLGFGLALGIVTWKLGGLFLFAFQPATHGSESVQIHLLVKRGQPSKEISYQLQSDGVVTNAIRFWRLGSLLRKWKDLKAGEYLVSSSMTPLEVFEVITSGISVGHPLTIQEGRNIFQIADALEARGLGSRDQFLDLCKDQGWIATLGLESSPPTLEGFLFPETYNFNKTMNEKEIIQTMVNRFNRVWKENNLGQQAKDLGFDQLETVTLASIVEKETGAPNERRLISSVFHNRLRKRMRLQSDPTTIYGIWETFNGNLRKHHLKEKNAYNTYAIRGLPAGPISNPGKEALIAALSPDQSDFLYFVSMNDGTHKFSKTFKEHHEAVKKYQMSRKARKGKSWRDLSKKLKK